MTDLTESRISEIRERLAAATPGPWEAVDYNRDHPERDTWLGIIRGAVEIVDERFQIARIKYSAMPHKQNVANAEFIAHAPADLEALLAEREGMKAEIDKQRDELASYAEEREMLRIIFGCPERARRIMSTLDSLRDRLSAPLDPSSAPGIGRIVARYASETRRLRAELESARSPDREAGSGTQHVCGKQGFGQRFGDVCPACTGEPDNV